MRLAPGLLAAGAVERWLRGQTVSERITWTVALAVGAAQVLAGVFPGTSRSAAAIFVALLAGLDESAIGACLAERITATQGAKTLVATLAALGTRTVLVTGGFHHFADPVAAMLGFDRVVGNRLEVTGGRLTGGLLGQITDSAVKAAVLREELALLGEDTHSLATGDGANDIPMLRAAGFGVAFHAKPGSPEKTSFRMGRGDGLAILIQGAFLLALDATYARKLSA